MLRSFIIFLIVMLSVCDNNLFAQTGLGGVLQTSDILLNYSANQGVFSDAGITTANNGNTIEQWNDLSGNGFHLEQTTSLNRPTYITNAINGFSVIRFDGSSSYMKRDFTPGSITDFTCLVIQSYDNQPQPNNDYDITYTLGNSFSNFFTFGRSAGNASSSSSYYAVASGTIKYGPSVSSGFKVYTQEINSSSTFHKFYYDGSEQVVSDFPSGISVARRIYLGRFIRSNYPHYFDGDLLELVLIDAHYNSTQNIILQNYYAAKYGLNLGNDKFAFEATHNNEVAGIGQESATDNHTAAQGDSILLIQSPSDLQDGEYAMWGHDNGGTGSNTTELAGDSIILDQKWRYDETGGNGVGSVSMTFDLSGIAFGIDPTKYIVLKSADADFSTSTVVGAVPTVNGSQYTFTGVDLDDGDYFTIANDGTLQEVIGIAEVTTASWSDAGQWISQVADSTVNALIIDNGAGSIFEVTGTQSVNDLSISTDVTLLVTGTLIIKGDLTVDAGGAIDYTNGGKIIFRGTDLQTATNNGSTAQLYDVTFSNPVGVTFEGGNGYELNNEIILNSGTVTMTDEMTFISDATNTAHFESVAAGSNFTGTIIQQRYIGPRLAGWNDIGTGVTGATIAELDDNLKISGVSGADGYAWNTAGGGFISIWYVDETGGGWTPVGHVNDNMDNGRGYEIWLADDLNNYNGGVFDVQGSVDLTDVAQLTLEVTTNNGGWNLLSNPVPAFLDFNAINTASGNITNSEFWTVEATTNTFQPKTIADPIYPSQGFWLNMTAGTDIVLDLSTDILSGGNGSSFYKNEYQPDEELRVLVQKKNASVPTGSNVYLRKNNYGFAGQDELDVPSLRLPGPESCELAFGKADSDKSLVNYVSVMDDHLELPINFDSKSEGEFEMTFDGLEEFYEYQCFNLVNHTTGEQIPVTPSSVYTFDAAADTPVNMSLVLSKEDYVDCLAPVKYSESLVEVSTIDRMVMADFHLDQSAKAEIKIYSITGSEIMNRNTTVGYSREMFNLEYVDAGVYLISVTVNGQTQTEKIILP